LRPMLVGWFIHGFRLTFFPPPRVFSHFFLASLQKSSYTVPRLNTPLLFLAINYGDSFLIFSRALTFQGLFLRKVAQMFSASLTRTSDSPPLYFDVFHLKRLPPQKICFLNVLSGNSLPFVSATLEFFSLPPLLRICLFCRSAQASWRPQTGLHPFEFFFRPPPILFIRADTTFGLPPPLTLPLSSGWVLSGVKPQDFFFLRGFL